MSKEIEKIRKAFSFYESFEECIAELDEHEGYELYRAISRYSLYGEAPRFSVGDLSAIARMAWRVIFPILQTARTKSKNGKKGGEASKTNNPTGINQYEVVKQEVKQEVKQDKDKDKDKSFNKDKSLFHSHNGADAPQEGESEDDFINRKEEEFSEYKKNCLTKAYEKWRRDQEADKGIQSWKTALDDFEKFCRRSTFGTQINSMRDFQRIFEFNAKKFLSEKALTEKDIEFSEEERQIGNALYVAIRKNQSHVSNLNQLKEPLSYKDISQMKDVVTHIIEKGYDINEVIAVIPQYINYEYPGGDILRRLIEYSPQKKAIILDYLIEQERQNNQVLDY